MGGFLAQNNLNECYTSTYSFHISSVAKNQEGNCMELKHFNYINQADMILCFVWEMG
jgi:hypothetical protein